MAVRNMNQKVIMQDFLPEERESHLSKEDLDYFQQLILMSLDNATKEIKRLRGSLLKDDMEKDDNASAYSWHMADAGTDAMDQEKTYIMIHRHQKMIGFLSNALDRIKNKTYGICKITGKPIARERLEAIPYTDLCLEAKLNGYD